MNEKLWSPKNVGLALLPILLLVLSGISIGHREYAEPLFIHTTYYFLLVTVACWAFAYLVPLRGVGRSEVWAWVKDNRAGIIIAVVITLITALAIQPALRVLSDEANLLGTSRSLFFTKTATFTTSGKYYYDNFWDAGVVIDRRPSLYPFLLSLLHIVRGYSYTNAFWFNLLLLPVFVLAAYRLAKVLGGELYGILAGILVSVHPITLISVRSGGFDFMAALFALLVVRSFLDHSREPSSERLLLLWMNLGMFAEIRYETALFVPPVVLLMLVFRMLKWELVRPYRFVYALTPAFLLPRLWQSILRGNVPEQDPGAVTFGFANFVENARAYFKPIFAPFDYHFPHASLVIGLGVIGCVLWLRWFDHCVLSRKWKAPNLKFATMVMGWMALQLVIVFTYVWGRPLHPAAARLFITIDTFFAFPAAWVLVVGLKRLRPLVPGIVAGALFAIYLPVASEFRVLNELTLTRETATTWRFFASLHEKRILIITDRPGLYTIMEYGAFDFDAARQDASLLDSLDRHLFFDIYLVQQIDLGTHRPVPQHEIWPERGRQPMIEFQNDANATIRVSRLLH
jgi:4-amino-4-deoxy-L-arabinose transferase-like glycosyltransferase